MATVQHSALTTTNLHEPKGVAAANAGEIYVADGAQSGAWTAQKVVMKVDLGNIATAQTTYVPIPFTCTVQEIRSCLQGAISTSDETLTFADNSGTSMGTIVITQSGSAAGDVDSLTPVSNNTFTDGQTLRVSSAGASTGTTDCVITVVLGVQE